MSPEQPEVLCPVFVTLYLNVWEAKNTFKKIDFRGRSRLAFKVMLKLLVVCCMYSVFSADINQIIWACAIQ